MGLPTSWIRSHCRKRGEDVRAVVVGSRVGLEEGHSYINVSRQYTISMF
jgi:hypothetical protein